jgi:mannosyl-3-phosphoglycerate phosphatase family protein
MILLFTDLDSTLLDSDSYSWEAARPAIDELRAEGIPWVFVTSKTRAEVEFWRRATGNSHPYIFENGAAMIIPQGYFPSSIPDSRPLDGADLVAWGTPYSDLVEALKRASDKSGCRVRSFAQMSVEQIAAETKLPLEQARLARMREFDEPFIVLDSNRASKLLQAIHDEGLHCVAGSRFLHITGANDKGVATVALQRSYEGAYGPLTTVGLGDSFNDLPLLENVSIPILIRSAHSQELSRLIQGAQITAAPGPEGWNRAVLDLISKHASTAIDSSRKRPAQR